MGNEFCQVNEDACIYGGRIRPGQCEGCPILKGIFNRRGVVSMINHPYGNLMNGVFEDGIEFRFKAGVMVESRHVQSI